MLSPFEWWCRNFILPDICKPCLFVFLRNLFYLTFFVAYGDSFSPPKRVLLWSETHPKISKEDALMKKIETHPSPEKLLRQVTEEAVNALALGGPDKIGDEAPMEVGVMLIAKAWGCLLYTSPSPRDCS